MLGLATPILNPSGARKMKLYSTRYNSMHSTGAMGPHMEVRGNYVYNTHAHPNGHSPLPQFEIKKDKFYRTIHHPEGRSFAPQYEIKGTKVFPTLQNKTEGRGAPAFRIHA